MLRNRLEHSEGAVLLPLVMGVRVFKHSRIRNGRIGRNVRVDILRILLPALIAPVTALFYDQIHESDRAAPEKPDCHYVWYV